MSYKRRMSQIIADARQRSGGLKTIDPALDLGGGLSVAEFDARIATAQAKTAQWPSCISRLPPPGYEAIAPAGAGH